MTIKLQLRLREAQFTIIECDWTKMCIATNARIVCIALTEKASDCDQQSVNSQNYWWVGGIIDGVKCGWSEEHCLECVLCRNLLWSKDEWCVFMHESGKWVSKAGEVPDEDTDDSYHSEECTYLRKVGAGAPIDNLVNLNRVQNVTFRGADMAYNYDFTSADKQLLTGKCSSTIFHTLNDSIDILEVLPNKVANAAIFQNSLEDSIIVLISRHGAVNRYIVDIWNSIFWNLGLKDVSYIVVKYGNRIHPSHR